MKTFEYKSDIESPRGVVWNTLVDPQLYTEWAKAFSLNSYFDGNWVQGSEIKFIDTERGGARSGSGCRAPVGENTYLAHRIDQLRG